MKLTDHMLEIVRGFSSRTLPQLTRPLSANVTVDVHKGRCLHLNASNEWETGCIGGQMPYFAQNASYDSDAMNDANDWGPSAIPSATPLITCIPATAAVELATTEFDPDQTYAIGEPLRAIVANTNAVTGGRLTNQGYVGLPGDGTPTDWTNSVGTVSRVPVARQPDRPEVLFFYPHHRPGATGL